MDDKCKNCEVAAWARLQWSRGHQRGFEEAESMMRQMRERMNEAKDFEYASTLAIMDLIDILNKQRGAGSFDHS